MEHRSNEYLLNKHYFLHSVPVRTVPISAKAKSSFWTQLINKVWSSWRSSAGEQSSST